MREGRRKISKEISRLTDGSVGLSPTETGQFQPSVMMKMANLFGFKKRKPTAFDSQDSLPTTSVADSNERLPTGSAKFSRFRFTSFRQAKSQPQPVMSNPHPVPTRNPSELDFDTGSYHSFTDQIYQGFSSSSSEFQSRPESFRQPQPPRPLVSVLKQKNSNTEEIYAEVYKPKKRVCFARDSDFSSTISYDCDVESTSTALSGQENFFRPPQLINGAGEKSLSDPDLCTTPTRSFPKTNPHFSFPKNILPWRSANRTPEAVKPPPSAITTAFPDFQQFYSGSSSSSSSASHDNSGSTLFSQQQRNENITRILRGMKSFGIKGELYVSALVNNGMMTVTIDEGRNLISPIGSTCNSYVRISLMPDEEKRTHCKTEITEGTNQPLFNQTFTFELLPEDYEKRLLISMWHRNMEAQKSILLGCMAFTVKHLLHHNKIEGWYFLLAPSLGRHKHLAVEKVKMTTYYGSIDSGLNDWEKITNIYPFI